MYVYVLFPFPTEDLKLDHGDCLGAGTFGVVHGASYLGTPVAVKVSRGAEVQDHARHLIALTNELRILRHIRHPNIVLFHGACLLAGGGGLAVILERVTGQRCDDFCAMPASIAPPSHRLQVLMDICRAVCYLHGQDPVIIHGDLKPSNIMVQLGSASVRPRAILLDFGLSRLLTPSAKALSGRRSLYPHSEASCGF